VVHGDQAIVGSHFLKAQESQASEDIKLKPILRDETSGANERIFIVY